jgi:carbon-monoxide dehydrogenase medium subunit
LPNAASRFGVVGVFAARTKQGVRVAVTGAAAAVFRLKPAEQALAVDFSPEALDGVEIDPAGLNDDIHASAEYRARMIVVMAARAVASARPSE